MSLQNLIGVAVVVTIWWLALLYSIATIWGRPRSWLIHHLDQRARDELDRNLARWIQGMDH
jgi:hypothetical protein